MKTFTINGQEIQVEANAENTFGDLMDHVRDLGMQDGQLLCSIRVNNIELEDEDEMALEALKLSEIESVAVEMKPARIVADETLGTLENFLPRLSEISRSAENHNDLGRLIDGIGMLAESVEQIRAIIGQKQMVEVDLLGDQLVELSTRLLDELKGEQKAGTITEARKKLLQVAFPAHFESWRAQGVPALIRGLKA
jgi:hypothetical protein